MNRLRSHFCTFFTDGRVYFRQFLRHNHTYVGADNPPMILQEIVLKKIVRSGMEWQGPK
jgi:hypothetical protein